jgi:cephalosporin-C deacetylase-like acetyl esterase
LVKGGFAVAGFTSALTGQRYHDLPMKMWFLSQLPQSVSATAHDVQLMIDYLEKRGDLDTSRIGMFGNGSSGTIGILASAADPRIKVLDVLDPWADWPTWLATSPFPPADERASYLTPEFLKSVSPLEPLGYLPKIQAKKFRIQDDVINPETPAAIKEKISKAAPAGTTFVQYKSRQEMMAAFPHSSNLDWLKQQLSALPAMDKDKAEKASAEKH